MSGWIQAGGDPTPFAWFVVLGYLAASLTAFAAARAARAARTRRGSAGLRGGSREARFWLMLGAVCVALAINKQLDLQSLLTNWGREMAKAQGWYERRRTVQYEFVAAIFVAALISLAVLMTWLRGASVWAWRASIGAACLAGFVLARAASFHHVDAFIGISVLGARMSHVAELVGIAVIAFTAAGRVWDGKAARRRIGRG